MAHARARARTYACICRIRCEDITRYMNITTHPLWIFIFPRRHNPPARFNHAVNLSARALIHRFFSVRLSAIGYNRNADIDFTLSRIPANGPSFVWEIFSRTRPSSCVSLHYITAFPLSLWAYLNLGILIPAICVDHSIENQVRGRRILDHGNRSIFFLADAAFRANFLGCRSRFVIFFNLPTSVINNPTNIALSASKIQRIWKIIMLENAIYSTEHFMRRISWECPYDVLRTSFGRF